MICIPCIELFWLLTDRFALLFFCYKSVRVRGMESSQLRVALLGFTVPDRIIGEVVAKDRNLPIQTHRFAWSLVRAVRKSDAYVRLLSVVPASNYPLMPRVVFRKKCFSEEGVTGVLLPFINLLGIKHITRFLSCLVFAKSDLRKEKIDVLLVHGVHSPFLWFGAFFRGAERKLVVVITDPPGVILPSDGRISRFLKRIDQVLVRKALAYADGVIALTDSLADDFAPYVPHIVMQGFLDRALEKIPLPERIAVDPLFNIVYAGGLHERYGAVRLLEAVAGSSNSKLRLIFFGKGDAVDRIKSVSKSDSRIVYGGVCSPEELIPVLQGADLLINPRPSDQDFIKYSFPSKLIEYMAMGVPVLTTRLAGVPEEYMDRMYAIDDESIEGIRAAILDVYNKSDLDRLNKAISARDFVLSSSSEEAQGNKIIRFLRSLF